MTSLKIYHNILKKKTLGCKQLAVLIDPDRIDKEKLHTFLTLANNSKIDYILVGGSLITSINNLEFIINIIKKYTAIPTILFPGSSFHLSQRADAILFLSLISGRNPEFLIGQHVIAAPLLKESNLEILPTGYILVNCGNQTTVSYISNTVPLPYDKPEIAVSTAIAGEMLGLKMIYLDGGSGAEKPIDTEMIKQISYSIDTPLIVGGGIKKTQQIKAAYLAGADIVVVGTSVEKNHDLLGNMAAVRNYFN